MRDHLRRDRNVMATGLLTLLLVLPAPARGQGEEPTYEGEVVDGVELLAEIYQLLLQNYAVDLDPMKLAEAGARGMVESLDDYTTYVSPELNREAYAVNHRVDPGIDLAEVEGEIRIVDIIAGSSAEQVGVRPGDLLLAVDGVEVRGKTIPEVLQLLDGEERKGIEITLRRGSQTLTLHPRRERLDRPALAGATLLPDSILYIDLDRFADYVGVALRSELLRIGRYEGPPERIRGMILDLRGNTGGKLREGIAIADMLLPSGSGIVSLDSRNSEDRMKEFSQEREILPDIPLVLLVDRRTASTSEVVAAALQDNHRAIILGEGSYGKGLVQSIERLSNGGFLHITSAWYRTPAGRSTQGPERFPVVPDSLRGVVGVRPDTIVVDGAAEVLPENSVGADLLWRLDSAYLFTLFASEVAAPWDRPDPALLNDTTLYRRFRSSFLEREPGTRWLLAELDSLRKRSGGAADAEGWDRLRADILQATGDLFDRYRPLITAHIRRSIIDQFRTAPMRREEMLENDPLVDQARTLLRSEQGGR